MCTEKLQTTTGEVPEEAKEGENQVDQKPPKERLEQLRRELLDKMKETAQAAAN
jgi:hypothetical protein